MMGHIFFYKIDIWLVNVSWHYETVLTIILLYVSVYVSVTVQFLYAGGRNDPARGATTANVP